MVLLQITQTNNKVQTILVRTIFPSCEKLRKTCKLQMWPKRSDLPMNNQGHKYLPLTLYQDFRQANNLNT